jgi:hypothetical protein
MSDADGGVVIEKKLAQCLVDKRFRLSVQSARCFVKNENVGLFDKRSCNGDALLLSTRELSTSCTDMCL